MITSVLVANRGEIARRVFRTCRDAGIATVAVFSDPDAGAPHVREADSAVRLPGAAPADTYLRPDLLVRAAEAGGADAVHPGYGFLAENAAFAQAVLDAGLVWIGPPPAAIAAMGSKTAAKRLMVKAGVPVLAAVEPGAARETDLPLLIKAAAGGGGRGMRVVRDLSVLGAELAAARVGAAAAFGDAEVFCEPYVEAGRHVEVQLLADTRGTVWALGDRDCSLQRRHQKVIEEAPAPGIPDGVRRRLHDAARLAARAVGYTGAGTAEFLLTPDGRFFFLEMNTRLQVEHPVTECVTGLDLVALQLRIAEGAALPGSPPAGRGHAVEARLYAEDPAQDWRPQAGTLHLFDIPGVGPRFAAGTAESGLRLDSAVDNGSAVGIHYDPMLAKVVAWAPTRGEAVRRLTGALARARIHGLTTNRELLVRALRHPAFLAGELHTGFLQQHHADVVTGPAADKESENLSAVAAALADAAANRATAPAPATLPACWRNVSAVPQSRSYQSSGTGAEHEVRYRRTRDGVRIEGHPDTRVVIAEPDRVVLETGGVRRTFQVTRYGAVRHVDSPLGAAVLTAVARLSEPTAQAEPGTLLAPMPGTVARIEVEQGDRVTAGQPILWLEAMKMEHRVTAPAAGTVIELRVHASQQVEPGALLAVVHEEPPGEGP